MATSYSDRTAKLYAKGGGSFPVCQTVDVADNITKNLSGVIIDQNIFKFTTNEKYIEQEFYLPDDYTRVDQTPHLTGFQFFGNGTKGQTIKYRLYRYDESLAPRSITDTQIINVSGNGTYATYTTNIPHYLDGGKLDDDNDGDTVTISGFNVSGFNGTFSVYDTPTTTTFRVKNTTPSTTITKYGRISRPPRKSVTLSNGVTYVKSATIPLKNIQATYYKLIKFNKKTKRLHLINRHVINKKIKIPKNAIIIDLSAGRGFEHPKEILSAFDDYFNQNSVTRGDLIKSHIKEEKKKNSKIINYKTVLYTNVEYSTLFKIGGKLPASFNKMLAGYGGKDFKKWQLMNAKLDSESRLEIWTPYKSKKEVITTKWTNKDITGETHYREYLDTDDRFDSPVGWVGVGEGETTVDKTGDQWFDIKFAPLEIADAWVNQKFKIVIVNDDQATFGYNVSSTLPNQATAYKAAGLPLDNTGDGTSSLTMRVLAATADEGTDFLSNKFRSTVAKYDSNNINAGDDLFWSSKPNPSKYGVENLYFDVSSDSGNSSVIDSIFLDPITSGVNFNVYYSADTTGPTDLGDTGAWDKLLWTWVPKTFKAHKKQNYVLPHPITAKYIKVEFSSLQASYYSPGVNDKPILYKKYPSWVVNYFLSIYNMRYNKTEDPVIESQTRLTYDLLNLAFNYYKGDIINVANKPVVIDNANQGQAVVNLLQNATVALNDYDQISLTNIKAAFDKFRRHPGYHTDAGTVVGSAATIKSINEYFNYSVEKLIIPRGKTDSVSTTDRNHLLLEKQMPTMYFYPICRHGYQKAYAKFENNKAYFVKIREIRFERNNHNVISDKDFYKFVPGDNNNFEHCDFIISSNEWSVL